VEIEVGASEFGAQEAVIEASVVRDENGTVEPVVELLRDVLKARRVAPHRVGDAGQPLDVRWNRNAGINQR